MPKEFKVPFLRSAFNYDANEVSDGCSLVCHDPTLAVQAEKDNCDINVIMERFGQGYQMPQGVTTPIFGDFVDTPDLATMLDRINEATASFMALPARVRARFDNNAADFVDFCSTPGNEDELMLMGLLPRTPKEEPSPPIAPVPAPDQ